MEVRNMHTLGNKLGGSWGMGRRGKRNSKYCLLRSATITSVLIMHRRCRFLLQPGT